jgi:hypothetical protein
LIYVDPYGLWREHLSEINRNFNEFNQGATRGFIDDTSWGISEHLLGEYNYTSLSSRLGYYSGTTGSLAAGLLYGSTEAKVVNYGYKACKAIYQTVKGAIHAKRATTALKHSAKFTEYATKIQPLEIQKVSQYAFKTSFKELNKTELVVGKNFKGFTKRNYRHYLKKLTRISPPSNVHAHHVFPQALEKTLLGINIHEPKYLTW